MIRRLDTIRDTLVSAKRDFERMKGVQKMMEGGEHEPGQPKEDLGPMIEGVKKEAAAAQANVDRLTAEEAQLTSDLSVEQSRWVDINRRLDELERTLAKR